MKRGLRRIVILAAVLIMAVGMVGGTFFSLLSTANKNEALRKEYQAEQEKELKQQAKKEAEKVRTLSYVDLDFTEFFTYLAYKGLPIQNPMESNLEEKDGNYIAQAHWEDGLYESNPWEENLGIGGWVEVFEDKAQAKERVAQLQERGYTHIYLKKSNVIYLNNEISDEAAAEYQSAFDEYENTTITEIES
ncbi:MAG: hypothetical protein KBT48_01900 [Firmicutes bacterium]|nr:hypothetical protein [Bacillota bacterium]